MGPAAFLGLNVSLDEKNGKTPMSQQMSMSLQQQIAGGWLIDVGYSGNLGHNFTSGGYDLNQLDPKYLSLGIGLQQQVPNPYAGLCPARSERPPSLASSLFVRIRTTELLPFAIRESAASIHTFYWSVLRSGCPMDLRRSSRSPAAR